MLKSGFQFRGPQSAAYLSVVVGQVLSPDDAVHVGFHEFLDDYEHAILEYT